MAMQKSRPRWRFFSTFPEVEPRSSERVDDKNKQAFWLNNIHKEQHRIMLFSIRFGGHTSKGWLVVSFNSLFGRAAAL